MDNNNPFDLFDNKWALVSAGSIDSLNCCTVSWGSLGILWGKKIVTIYVYPSRYTCDFLLNNEYFTISVFDKEYKNDTCDSFEWESSSEVKNMYKNLWKNFNLKDMKLIEWEYYTYEHQYLWTIEVQICRLKYNWEFINFRFAKAKNDPLERVRIEEITYADAKLTSFGIYDRQINAAPLTGKPIEYSSQVPYDMKNNERINGSSYIDIRDLYQENPIIKQFKRISSI